MPVVSMMRIAGDPDDLEARLDEHVAPVSERLATKHGGLLNIVARDGDAGILVINVWETEEGRHAMAQEPEIQSALAAAAFPTPAFEGYEIISLRTSEKIAEHAVSVI
jgi:hypothetical protein